MKEITKIKVTYRRNIYYIVRIKLRKFKNDYFKTVREYRFLMK